MRTVLLAALCFLAAPAANAEVFTAVIDGASAGTPSTGTGFAQFTLSDDLTSIEFIITFSNLMGTEAAAHVHRPLGGVIFTFNLGSPKVGTWLFPLPEDVARLRNGELYVNIHTNLYPGGEIRGNLAAPNPVRNTTWGAIKALYAN